MAEFSERIGKYLETINVEVLKCYDIANEAKSKGFDPNKRVMMPLAKNMAERVEGLIGSVAPEILGKGVPKRIQELEKEYGMQDWRVALKIAEEVALEKFCKFEDKIRAMEIGIRTGFAYVTVGVVASPLEGFIGLKVRERMDGQGEYLALIYGGPIRSAGGTGASVSILIADYVRKIMGYKEYDATEKEVKRAYSELCDYHERVTNLQYFPSEEEIKYLVEHLPIQLDGDPSEKWDVSNYKDLSRRVANRISNGFCLITAECLGLKAPKVWKQLAKWGKDMDMEQWNFMKDFVDLQKEVRARGVKVSKKVEAKLKPDTNYIKDLVAGRPVFTHPMRNGGFRLRYGRGRVSGFSADSVNPATMVVSDDFIAVGTQFKVERPGKATVANVCDTIDGPIVKLKNGSVVCLNTYEDARLVAKEVDEIIYLGDLLVNYGDFLDRAHKLIPCGFVEEWWAMLVEKKISEGSQSIDGVEDVIKFPLKNRLSLDQAIEYSEKLGVPLYPKYIYFWDSISVDDFKKLYLVLKDSSFDGMKMVVADLSVKRSLELIGCEHKLVGDEHLIIDDARALVFNLGGFEKELVVKDDVLEMVNSLCKFEVKDKCGTFVGARMGRPEKAKMRKMKGSPHVLFPVGDEGGRLRCFQSSLEAGKVSSNFPYYICECGKQTIYPVCENCGKRGKQKFWCRGCKELKDEEECEKHDKCSKSVYQQIDIKHYFYKALEVIGSRQYPSLIKGVRGMSSVGKIPEHLVRGILRAKNSVHVNKDGTIRYDMIELPLTHFKPKEIGTPIEKLKELGYLKDVYGEDLVNDEQILELIAQDVVLPAPVDAPEQGADEVLFRVGGFIDDLLVHLYKMDPYYKFEKKSDLIGHLIVAMSPHTSAGIVSRIIGFSKAQGLYAHPLLHSIMRRDCVHPSTELVIGEDKKLVKIGDYVEDLIKRGAKTKRIDLVGTLSVENIDDVCVYGVDSKTFEFKEKKVKSFIKGPVNNKWVVVKSLKGKEFVMTPDHNHLSIVNGNFKIIKAKEVSVKDKLIVWDGKVLSEQIVEVSSLSDPVNSYCLDVEDEELIEKSVLWGDNIINLRCDGDEAGCMLLMDCLLNFSMKYLPNTRGISQDAPLVLTSRLVPSEVDDMVFNMDICDHYPLELYEAAEEYKYPWDIKIHILENDLGTEKQYEGMMFTHDTSDFNNGVLVSAYKTLPSMREKVLGQMEVGRKIRAVDVDDVARLVIERHFIRDIKGNLRKFSQQGFRCVKCNEIYRRPPLAGKCLACSGKLVFTIAEGSICKYLQPALDLAKKYNLPAYLQQSLVLLKNRIESVFGKDPEKQEGLGKWF
ncbi:DNA polymerase II large subunit [archaeon]|jgi:DNA polymerase II large subunit|nr:DNA polymerase II large subunit [archaeon]MBT4417513.1 DNA polymerase II large subunit [archaeon]